MSAPIPREQDTQVRRELVSLVRLNAGRSVLLLTIAGAFVAWMGYERREQAAAIAVIGLVLLVAATRLVIGRMRLSRDSSRSQIDRIERAIAANSLGAGLTWAVATLSIYPALAHLDAGVHLVIVLGSAAVAVQFMPLVRWAYPLLVIPSIGSLAAVSVIDERVRSYPLALLAVIFIATLLRAGAEYRDTATRAIRHGLDAAEANASLKQAKEQAEAGAIAKSQFLATMSHEIRTPMNGVLGALELLRRSGLTDDQKRLVRTASSSGETLMSILNDVLDHSKIEAGMLTLHPSGVSLHKLLSSVVGLFRANAQSKGLALELSIDPRVADRVIVDGQRLKQVLLNLVSNAIKFTERGGVWLIAKPSAAAYGYAGVEFEVHDSGPGIDAEARQRLFVPFTQVGVEAHHSRKGTGLGLAISQRIAQAMGSRIEVETVPGEGSCFRFRLSLPLDESEPGPPAPETASGALDAMQPVRGTVLVAEDDPVNRLIAREMLESLGVHVVEAGDGEEALTRLNEHRIDLVFMDCQMPKLDGYATTRRWREREARVGQPRKPIIALTANAFDDDIERARAAGMDDHLSKPYTRVQLREYLAHWMSLDGPV